MRKEVNIAGEGEDRNMCVFEETPACEKGRSYVLGVWTNDEIGWIDAHDWNYSTKWMTTLLVSSISAVVAFATAIPAPLAKVTAHDLGVSQLHETSATATFLFGFGIGSLVTGPFSEVFGRSIVFIITMFLMMVCLAIAGCADTLAQQVVFRFCAGFLGSSPLVCAGGSLSDLWTPHQRLYVFPVFAIISYGGSTIAPIVGGAIVRIGASWRWGDWITTIVSGVFLFLVIVCLPETFRPILLKYKTRSMAGEVQHQHAEDVISSEREAAPSLWYQGMQGLYRPFVLTAHEGIVILYTWYIALIYIILLTFLNGFNYIFEDIYGFNEVETGLTFLSQFVGNCMTALLIPYANCFYSRDLERVHGRADDYNNKQKTEHGETVDKAAAIPPPESHLYYAMVGAPFIPVSLFWMAYTSRPDISPWSPIIAASLFGFGFTSVFISCYQYLTACYGIWSASVLAAVNCLRSLLSGGMMMASVPMYSNIGVMWSVTILGIAAAIMTPVPYAFYFWGDKVRSHSRHAYKGGV
ncbi:major facilitator superfamily domain-containing protein [Aspergillus filifer]